MAKKPESKSKGKSTVKPKSVKKAVAKKKVKAKTTVKKSPAKKKTEAKKPSKKNKRANLLKLYSEMTKMATDAVDKEVIKRFKVIIDTYEEDITKKSLKEILKDPKNVDANSFSDMLQPYIKHYLFLVKREIKKK